MKYRVQVKIMLTKDMVVDADGYYDAMDAAELKTEKEFEACEYEKDIKAVDVVELAIGA